MSNSGKRAPAEVAGAADPVDAAVAQAEAGADRPPELPMAKLFPPADVAGHWAHRVRRVRRSVR